MYSEARLRMATINICLHSIRLSIRLLRIALFAFDLPLMYFVAVEI